jgi:hypothetical protein
MTRKRRLAAAALWPAGDTLSDVAYLGEAIKQAKASDDGDPVLRAVEAMFIRDRQVPPPIDQDGVIFLPE